MVRRKYGHGTGGNRAKMPGKRHFLLRYFFIRRAGEKLCLCLGSGRLAPRIGNAEHLRGRQKMEKTPGKLAY